MDEFSRNEIKKGRIFVISLLVIFILVHIPFTENYRLVQTQAARDMISVFIYVVFLGTSISLHKLFPDKDKESYDSDSDQEEIRKHLKKEASEPALRSLCSGIYSVTDPKNIVKCLFVIYLLLLLSYFKLDGSKHSEIKFDACILKCKPGNFLFGDNSYKDNKKIKLCLGECYYKRRERFELKLILDEKYDFLYGPYNRYE